MYVVWFAHLSPDSCCETVLFLVALRWPYFFAVVIRLQLQLACSCYLLRWYIICLLLSTDRWGVFGGAHNHNILLSVCPQHIFFCNCPTRYGLKWLPLGATVPTRHYVSSTDQNWQSYWSLTLTYVAQMTKLYVVIFAKNLKKIEIVFIFFFAPRRAFLVNAFGPRTVVALALE